MDYYGATRFDQLDVSWLVLITVAIFMFISSLVTIIVLCVLWRRHQRLRQTMIDTPLPVQIDDRPSASYETQKMEMFVPQDDGYGTQRNVREFHPEDILPPKHEFYPRTNRAYF